MNPITLHLPPGVQVRGELLDSMDPECLLQDILSIKLPNGIIIDVGWYPECDPAGVYRVVVFREYWRNQLTSFKTRNLSEVVAEVERMARMFYSLSTSSSSDSEYCSESSKSLERQSCSGGSLALVELVG